MVFRVVAETAVRSCLRVESYRSGVEEGFVVAVVVGDEVVSLLMDLVVVADAVVAAAAGMVGVLHLRLRLDSCSYPYSASVVVRWVSI